MAHKVVAHFIDHDILKGTSVDVDPGKPLCHVHSPERGNVEVDLAQVKALFFVRDFGGQPEYDESHRPQPGDARLRGSHLVELTFGDGETLGCLMNRYPPNRPFFFVLPMDQRSNNIRMLINRAAVTSMREVTREMPTPIEEAPLQRPRRTSWVFDGRRIKEVDGR